MTVVERLEYTIENGDTVIVINNTVPTGFVKLEGRTGFGVAPTSLITIDGAIGGSKWRRTRRGARSIDLPLGIFGTSRQDVENKLRLLIRTLGDKVTPARLVATYPNGERVYTEVHYSGGINPVYGSDADTEGQEFCRIILTLVAPRPYWTEETAVTYAVAAPVSGRNLLPALVKLRVSSSQALGSVTVENPGDVEAWPVWTITGPGSSFTLSLGDLELSYPTAIAVGEVITVDTVTKKVTSSVHGNVFANLAPAPKFFPIPAGASEVEAEVIGATSAAVVTMYFNPRRELVY